MGLITILSQLSSYIHIYIYRGRERGREEEREGEVTYRSEHRLLYNKANRTIMKPNTGDWMDKLYIIIIQTRKLLEQEIIIVQKISLISQHVLCIKYDKITNF